MLQTAESASTITKCKVWRHYSNFVISYANVWLHYANFVISYANVFQLWVLELLHFNYALLLLLQFNIPSVFDINNKHTQLYTRTRTVGGQWRHQITIYGYKLTIYFHIWWFCDVTDRLLFSICVRILMQQNVNIKPLSGKFGGQWLCIYTI